MHSVRTPGCLMYDDVMRPIVHTLVQSSLYMYEIWYKSDTYVQVSGNDQSRHPLKPSNFESAWKHLRNLHVWLAPAETTLAFTPVFNVLKTVFMHVVTSHLHTLPRWKQVFHNGICTPPIATPARLFTSQPILFPSKSPQERRYVSQDVNKCILRKDFMKFVLTWRYDVKIQDLVPVLKLPAVTIHDCTDEVTVPVDQTCQSGSITVNQILN